MLLDLIRRFNWVDILIIIVLFRTGYISLKNGLKVEIFKLLGTLLGLYLAMHYYTSLSDWFLRGRDFAKEKIPLEFFDLFSFVSLAITGYLVFVAVRVSFFRFLKMEAVPKLDYWGGFALGLARAFFLIGLIVFSLVISSTSYLKMSVVNSCSGRDAFKIAPAAYGSIWNGLASKFMGGEKFNKTILEVQKNFSKK